MKPIPQTGSLALRLEEAPDDVEAREALARVHLDRGQHEAAVRVLDGLPSGGAAPASFAQLRERVAEGLRVVGPAEISEEGPSCNSCLEVMVLGVVGFLGCLVIVTTGMWLPALEFEWARRVSERSLDASTFSERQEAVRWLHGYGDADQRQDGYLATFVRPERWANEDDALAAVQLLVELDPDRDATGLDGHYITGQQLVATLEHPSALVQARALSALSPRKYSLDFPSFDALFSYVLAHRDRWGELIPLLERRLPRIKSLGRVRFEKIFALMVDAIESDDPRARAAALCLAPLVKEGPDIKWGWRIARLGMNSSDPKAVVAGTDLGLHYGLLSALDAFIVQTRNRGRGFKKGGYWRTWKRSRKLERYGYTELRKRFDDEQDPYTKQVLEGALAKTVEGLAYLVDLGKRTRDGRRVKTRRKRRKRRKR